MVGFQATFQRTLEALDPELKNAFHGSQQLWTGDSAGDVIYERITFDQVRMMGKN